LILDGGDIIAEAPKLPPDVVDSLRAVKLDLTRILVCREAARAVFSAAAPPDCSEERWTMALRGLRRFLVDGWGDRAALMGWTKDELYRVPALWRRVDLAGAALLIADFRVVAVTEESIAITTNSGSGLKFRRIGREHVA
jgi:hypothetical protein